MNANLCARVLYRDAQIRMDHIAVIVKREILEMGAFVQVQISVLY